MMLLAQTLREYRSCSLERFQSSRSGPWRLAKSQHVQMCCFVIWGSWVAETDRRLKREASCFRCFRLIPLTCTSWYLVEMYPRNVLNAKLHAQALFRRAPGCLACESWAGLFICHTLGSTTSWPNCSFLQSNVHVFLASICTLYIEKYSWHYHHQGDVVHGLCEPQRGGPE